MDSLPSPRARRDDPVVEGAPHLVLSDDDREPLADLIAEILVSELEREETPRP